MKTQFPVHVYCFVVVSVERARVLFSYSAENEDELSLEEGATIVVLDKELEDSGWWKGEMDGKVGVFPDNFVELLPHEEVRALSGLKLNVLDHFLDTCFYDCLLL